ncbi:filamentous hemagglutinin N-terminal domain-containing protein, partial [bacterium]|nr:filamentous hemagglutinin N-terminal domain-containing protein [bacterium]
MMNATCLIKRVSFSLICMIFPLIFPLEILALPQGGQVVAGQARISQADPRTMNINQGTNKAIINWQQFSIAHPEAVRFIQPGATSAALNRVIGIDPSAIYGQLSANGRIFLINPNGILVGPTGQINVNAFIGSTLDISNEDFLSGNHRFSQNPARSLTSIVNQGVIQAAEGGYVSLLAPAVRNEGTIVAKLGKVFIGSGERITLNFEGDNMLSFAVDESIKDKVVGLDGKPLSESISNEGRISAEGGQVILSARTAYEAIKSVVNNDGIIEAKSLVNQNGVIKLVGGNQGIVSNSGVLDASGKEKGQTGGTVHVLGEKVGLFDSAMIDVSGYLGAGTVLLGGDFQGKNPNIQNASRTYVGPDASIIADAITNGDGGKVIVWADDWTKFYGSISARGGDLGGDGGFVEVSGKENLGYYGHVDALAPMGTIGTLLLDPLNITIQDAGADVLADVDDVPFATNPGTSYVLDASEINNAAAEVNMQARGFILFNEAISITTDNVGIVAEAGGDITVSTSITTRGGVLNFSANDADSGNQSGTGSVIINASLDTSALTGGTVTLNVDGGTGNIQL